ncbi:MAG: topoisomerase DNA-binding C4 zinc finger domain-containing protein [Desulfobacterales bacterium]|nr:topoisomerase DNA-binding C4 zinc finger domain-containing protein [Desulfobacterales bacterium]
MGKLLVDAFTPMSLPGSKPNIHFIEQTACPECDGMLKLRESKHGIFLGCSTFPKCRYKEKIL